MSQDVILFDQNQSAISTAFAGMVDEIGGDLSGGVQGSYAILSFKGSRFSVKYQGNAQVIMNEQGDPVGSFEAVLVKSNPYLTKQFYAKGFVEGDASPPDCFSLDGKVPSDSSPQKQNPICATCPQNAFTKINESTGKKTKACQDNRKVAVLPGDDLVNELFGGPMLMRVPAASLKDLALFGDTLKSRGFSYNSVRVRISFDISVSYPKLVFKAIRPLSDEEAVQVIEWYGSDSVNKMLADFADIKVPPEDVPVVDDVFEQPQAAAPAPAPKPVPPVIARANPVQAKAAPQAPAAPSAASPKPAGVSFGAKAKPAGEKPIPGSAAAPKAPAAAKPKVAAQAPAAPAPSPIVLEGADPAVDTSTEVIPGNLENDIADILANLNAISSVD